MGRIRKPSKLLVKRGAYGKSKTKAFAVMSNGAWHSSKELCCLTAISYPSLGRTLCRWIRYGYLTREPIEYGGKYIYCITPVGRKWLSLAKRYLPNYQQFIDELEAWQSFITEDAIDELMNCPFKEFLASLDNKINEFRRNVEIGGKKT